MPTVPNATIPTDSAPLEAPSEELQLIAAAEMHKQGRFQTDPQGRFTPLSEDQLDAARSQADKMYWNNLPEEEYHNKIQRDADRNEIAVPVHKDWDEYMKIWNEKRKGAIENEKLFQLSPKQLRQKGIKP